MGLMKSFFSQTRKPEGLLGKMMLNGMNPGHAKLADWGFTYLPKLTPERIIDIGCGKGRVLAYLVGKGVPCKLTGIEINPEVASVADRWTKRYRNIEIVEGDAFGLDYNDYTVLFMYRPMESDVFKGFVNLLEMTLTHPVKFYYYADGQSGYYLNERPGWDLMRREELHSARGFYIHKVPQRFSVWQYTP